MTLTREQRLNIAKRMRGNKNALGSGRRVFLYRPSINRSNTLALLINANSSPIEFDWVSGGRVGISTNDPARAAAWVTKARELGYTVRDAARHAPTRTNFVHRRVIRKIGRNTVCRRRRHRDRSHDRAADNP